LKQFWAYPAPFLDYGTRVKRMSCESSPLELGRLTGGGQPACADQLSVRKWISLRMAQFSLAVWTVSRKTATGPRSGPRRPSATPNLLKVPRMRKLSGVRGRPGSPAAAASDGPSYCESACLLLNVGTHSSINMMYLTYYMFNASLLFI
jgi:hypothetical protein